MLTVPAVEQQVIHASTRVTNHCGLDPLHLHWRVIEPLAFTSAVRMAFSAVGLA